MSGFSHHSSARARSLVMAALAAALALCLLGGTSAVAATTATLKVAPAVGHPQQRITLSGTGYAAGESVSIYFDAAGTTVLARTNAGGLGRFANLAATVPATAKPGMHAFVAVGARSHRTARAAFLVRTDWPMPGFGSQSTYANPYENVLNAANVNGLRPRWSATADPRFSASAPVVANGLVIISTFDTYVMAFDATTGAPRWRTDVGDEWSWFPPVVDGSTVYVVTGDLGELCALDARTGSLKWLDYTQVYWSAPFAANGVVYAGTMSEDGAVRYTTAYDGTTGAVRWNATVDGDVVAVANGVVYVTTIDGATGAPNGLVTLDASNGHQLWSAPPLNNISVANGLVYGTNAKTLYARDARSGVLRWSSTQQSALFGSTAVAGNVVYADTTQSGASRVHAYNATSGQQIWSAPAGGTTVARLSVANRVVYVSTRNGRVAGLDAGNGAAQWTAVVGPAVWGTASTPIVANGFVYFTTAITQFENRVVHAYALPPG